MNSQPVSKPVSAFIGFSCTVLPLLVLGFVLHASVGLGNVSAWLRNEVVSVEPAVIEFKDSQHQSILVRNLSSQPLVVSGVEASCSCVSIEGLPTRIDAYSTANLAVSVGEVVASDRGREFVFRLICDGKCAPYRIVLNPEGERAE